MIKLIKSSFLHEKQTKEALAEFILNADIFSMNDQCTKFETAFAKKQKRKHAVYVSNGSIANLLLIQALLKIGLIKKGDRVGFSALTWPTNVMPLIQLGLTPVAIDCELENLNISPSTIKKSLDKIDALFLTNVLGFSDDIAAIREICKQNSILLIEDNCESLGSIFEDELLGNFSLASTFSFFVGHHISTIEGGMVCTDDNQLHESLLIARSHGWDRNLPSDAQKKLRDEHSIDDFYSKYTFYDLASNFRPNEINGFLGNIQLGYWDEIVNKRAGNFHKFLSYSSANQDFYPLNVSHMQVVSNFAMPIICKTIDLAIKYRERFEEAGVEVRPVIAGNMTKQPFYQKYVQDIQECPIADLIHSQGFYFGNNPEMTDDEIDFLCKLLRQSNE